MNERNYQLAKQAGLYHKTTLIESAVPLDQMLDKFVELVVKETMQVVANNLPQNTYLDVADAVIEHFKE